MVNKKHIRIATRSLKAFTFAAIGTVMSLNAAAGDIRDQMEVVTGKAELVIPGMAAQQVAAQVKEAISQWAIPANLNYRSMPSTIPARPDEPGATQKYYNGAPAVSYHCPTAYAEITKLPPPVKNAFAFIAEGLQACVYPFQKGTKIYLLHTRVKKLESLTSGLFGGITKAIQGTDDEWISKQMNENIAAIKKNIPSLLIEKIEIPGAPTQEPDKEAVSALIPEKVAAPPSPPVSPPLAGQAAPQSPTAGTPVPSSTQAKIEARKNLNGIGMQYHSKEQFIAAIKRKDDVAVQLFLDAGGIDLTAKENGKTFVTIAEEAGATDIAKLISDRVATPKAVPITPPGASPSAALGDKDAILAKLEATLSPSEKAEVEETLSRLPQNMSAEEKTAARIQILSMRAQIKKFADRIDPETGRLR